MPKPRKRKPKPKFKAGKRISCRLTQANGEERYVTGYTAVPGLAVFRQDSRWYVTHIISGLSAVPSRGVVLERKRDAFRWARCLAEFLDFNVDVPEFGFSGDIEPVIKRFQRGHNPNA